MNGSKDMGFHLNNIEGTDLSIGTVFVDLSVEVIHCCLELDLL